MHFPRRPPHRLLPPAYTRPEVVTKDMTLYDAPVTPAPRMIASGPSLAVAGSVESELHAAWSSAFGWRRSHPFLPSFPPRAVWHCGPSRDVLPEDRPFSPHSAPGVGLL